MKKRILLVEDEKDLVKMVSFRLEQSGYEVTTAFDGEEGYRLAKETIPDLILLDLMLPKMNGYKMCGLLKSDVRYKDILIIIFTARAQESDRQMCQDLGADGYVTKPFDAKELTGKIEEVFKKRA